MGIIAPDPQALPPIPRTPEEENEAYASKIREVLDRKSPYDHVHHIRKFRRQRKADLFYQSIQWLRASYNDNSLTTCHLSARERDPKDPDAIPMPVYNEMVAHIQNESARLGRPEYKPYVRPSGRAPDAKIKEACRKGSEILAARLEEMGWDEIAEQGYHLMPMHGGWWLKSWWDFSMGETRRVPVDTAHRCPAKGCDFRLASLDLTAEQAGEVDTEKPDASSRIVAEDVETEPGKRGVKYSVSHCLQCDTHEAIGPQLNDAGDPVLHPVTGQEVMGPVQSPGPSALEPFDPVDGELQQTDRFGRSFGKDVPLGQWMLKTCSGYDVFAQNLGMNVTAATMQEVCEVHIESLDWIRDRYPTKADQVKPEAPSALLKWHPIAGERAVYANTATGEGVFRNHCRVKEFHKQPYMEQDPATGKWARNLGRSIIMAGNVVLSDGPLLIESRSIPGAKIPRVKYDYIPWELRDGGLQLDGVGLAELMFDAQENINEGKSQTQDCRKRMASPKYLVSRGMNLDYEVSGGAGSQWQYDPDPANPQALPQEVGSTTISEGVGQEINRDLEYMERVSGKSSVEDGGVPPTVGAASAIQMLAEQTAERRRPRIRRIRKMFERVWRHGLELMHEFVVEEREYPAKNDAGDWCDRAWTGADIASQFNVRIDAEPEHDTTIQKQERTRDAISTLRIINPQDPEIARLVAKQMDLPPELFEGQQLQDEAAELELLDFLESDRPPVIDADLDSHAQHYDRHGKDLHNETWREIESAAKWDEALVWLSGWDKAPAMPPMPMAVDPSLPPPPPPMSPFDVFEQQVAPGLNLPPLPELHILGCWTWILTSRGYLSEQRPRPAEEMKALNKLMRARAHMSAHKREEQAQVNAAQAGMQQVAAPEAPATAAGTIPGGQMAPAGVAA